MTPFTFMANTFYILCGVICVALVLIIAVITISSIFKAIKPKEYKVDDFEKHFSKKIIKMIELTRKGENDGK